MVLRPEPTPRGARDLRQMGTGFPSSAADRHRAHHRAPSWDSRGRPDIPLAPLNDRRRCIRPTVETQKLPQINPARVGSTAALWKLWPVPIWRHAPGSGISTTARWVAQTVKGAGAADGGGLEGLTRALALTTDCTPRCRAADPEAGGAQAVAEAWRNRRRWALDRWR